MIKHNPKLEWYAFEHDINSDKFERINVLRSKDILDRINKGLKTEKDYWKIYNYETLKKAVKNELMYRYWSKCEYEYEVKGLFGDKSYKLDVFYQLEPNMDRIVEYIAREMNIQFDKKGNIVK